MIAEQKISLFCVLKQECHCQRENVSCSGGGLDIIPITLNPMMKRLSLRDNNIRVVDASLNFYTQVSRPLIIFLLTKGSKRKESIERPTEIASVLPLWRVPCIFPPDNPLF